MDREAHGAESACVFENEHTARQRAWKAEGKRSTERVGSALTRIVLEFFLVPVVASEEPIEAGDVVDDTNLRRSLRVENLVDLQLKEGVPVDDERPVQYLSRAGMAGDGKRGLFKHFGMEQSKEENLHFFRRDGGDRELRLVGKFGGRRKLHGVVRTGEDLLLHECRTHFELFELALGCGQAEPFD